MGESRTGTPYFLVGTVRLYVTRQWLGMQVISTNNGWNTHRSAAIDHYHSHTDDRYHYVPDAHM